MENNTEQAPPSPTAEQIERMIQKGRESGVPVEIPVLSPEMIRQLVKNAISKGDARTLEPICDSLREQEEALEAELGLSRGQLTNNPRLVDLRTLRRETEEGRIRAWEVMGSSVDA